MYLPSYTEGNETLCKELIAESPLGLLVSANAGELTTSYLPFALQESEEELKLLTHFARANPQWRNLNAQQVLVSFLGPNTYISPSIFSDAPNTVPTWSYAIAQVKGTAKVLTDARQNEKLLSQLTEHFENRNGSSWKANLPPRALDGMLAAIIGVEVTVTQLTGKFKLSQNRTSEERHTVGAHLQQSPQWRDNEVFRWMRKFDKT
jgi:transcriptional regulator